MKFPFLALLYLFSSNLAFGLSNIFVFGKFWMDGRAYPSLLIVVNIATLIAFWVTQQFRINSSTQIPQLVYKQVEYFFVLIFLVLTYWFSVNSDNYNKESITLFFTFSLVLNVLFSKFYINFRRKRIKEVPINKTLLIGSGAMSERIKNDVKSNKWLGYNVVMQLEKFPKEVIQLKKEVEQNKIQSIFIDLDSVAQTTEREEALRDLSENQYIKCWAFSSVLGKNLARGSYMLVGTTQLVPLFTYPLDNLPNKILKRIFDIFLSIVMFFLVFIWLFPLLAILIVIGSGFPVFFRQKRHGMDNKEFNCYKFRTMVVNTESDHKTTQKGDARITRLGQILRKTSIDELPQLWNILKGDMSVVGPRPHMVKQNNFYNQIIDKYILRHYVKPGLTGLAQVKGFRGEINNKKDMENRIKEDIYYVRNWSFFLDLKIMFLTAVKILKGDENAI